MIRHCQRFLCNCISVGLLTVIISVHSLSSTQLRGQFTPSIPFSHLSNHPVPVPVPNLNPSILQPPLPISILPDDDLTNASLVSSFGAAIEPARLKVPLSDKLHHAQQSLNDLFSDLLSKPLSLSHITNGSFLALDQIFPDKVKLPRPLNSLIASIVHSDSNISPANSEQRANLDVNNNELSTAESTQQNNIIRATSKLLSKSGGKKKKNIPLSNLMGRCYEPYGCFRISEPFRSIYRPINLTPEPPSVIKVSFHLRTRANPSIAERLSYTESSKFLKSQYFNPSHKLKIIVHGYLENSDESWIKEMSAALLIRDELNVVSVDWMLGAAPPYTQAVANTRLVGAIIAHLIQIIQDTYPERYPASKIHIIGHSLGAHIAGYTGELISNLGHITGLDPAEPYFQYTDPLVRLDPNDAAFVDVVHTDVASIITGGFGMNQTCGHVDFYPNGGVDQPGCKEAPIKNVWDSISKEKSSVFDGIRRFIGCNHLRSFLLYIEAINSECPFMAFPCRSYEDFTSGQCTHQLMEQQYYGQCFSARKSSPLTANLTSCPIRLGLESELDFRAQTTRSGQSENEEHHTASSLSYFVQTADRAPFCHYHYDITVVVRSVTPHRYVRKFRSRQLGESSALNGRLYVSLVGTRSRTVAEMIFKSETGEILPKTSERMGREVGGTTSATFKEQHILISDTDLGNVIEVELEWRPAATMQLPLMQVQPRAIKRWFSQLPTLDTSIPTMLNELQRTLNLNATQLQAHTSNLLSHWPYQLNELLHIKQEQSTSEQPTSYASVDSNMGGGLKEMMPLLEGIIVTKMETQERQVFCANEPALRTIFQPKAASRSGILITSSLVNSNQLNIDDQPRTTETIMHQLCLGDIL